MYFWGGGKLGIGIRGNHTKLKKYILANLKLISSKNTSLAAPGALAHRLQRRTTCKIQNGLQGAPKMADVVWKGV